MQRRYFLANVVIIGLSVAFLAHFSLIAYYGQLVIREPHPIVLVLEMTGLIGLIVFAALNLAR
jgi:hypothetical protein